jgi:cytochrome P450
MMTAALAMALMNLRYGLRYYVLYFLTLRHNVGFIWVTDVADARMYLQSSSKGNFIEAMFSRRAWQPILSLESENGATWTMLKERLLALMTQLPDRTVLKDIVARTVCVDGTLVTSKEIGMLTIQVFMQYVFGDFALDEPPDRQEYHRRCCAELYDASLEFRKEIALKGHGNVQKKQRAVDVIRNYLRESKYNLPDDIFSVSVVLQPFIISPAINVSDIAVHWDLNQSVHTNITQNHPFNILEREIVRDGRRFQVFIPTDELQILPFGYGERKCAGQGIATAFLETFFTTLIQNSIYKPKLNHLYSGRDNDHNDDFEAVVFQIKTVIRAFL